MDLCCTLVVCCTVCFVVLILADLATNYLRHRQNVEEIRARSRRSIKEKLQQGNLNN